MNRSKGKLDPSWPEAPFRIGTARRPANFRQKTGLFLQFSPFEFAEKIPLLFTYFRCISAILSLLPLSKKILSFPDKKSDREVSDPALPRFVPKHRAKETNPL